MKQLLFFLSILLCSFENMQAQGVYGALDIRVDVSTSDVMTEPQTEGSQYMLFSAIKLKPDGVQVTGPSNIILGAYPHFELIYFQKHQPYPAATKLNANFNFSYFENIHMFGQNAWDTVAPLVHGSQIELMDSSMNLIRSFTADDFNQQEVRPHVFGNLVYQGDTLFYVLTQNWMEAQVLMPEVDYPYYFDFGGDSITANTIVNQEFLIVFDIEGTVVKEIDVTQYATFEDMDPRQYTGIHKPNPVLHLNNVDVAIDEMTGEPVFALSSRNTNKAFFLDWSGGLMFRFPDDGYKLESGGYAAWDLNLSRPHGLEFASDTITNVFQMHWYNNGGGNTFPAAESLNFEVNINDPNPQNAPYTYGKLWGFMNFDVTSNELGNTRSFGNIQFTNYGRIDNDAPTAILPKMEWRDKVNPNIVYAEITLNEFRKETFNTEHYSSQVFGFIESMRPQMWVENDRLYATEGHEQYLWIDGTITSENWISLPSLDTNELGVAVPFGDDHGWITAPTLTVSEVLAISEKQSYDMAVYPNPARSGSEITLGADSYREVVLRDMCGKSIMVYANQNRISLPELSPGIYAITATKSNGVMSSTRLVIQ